LINAILNLEVCFPGIDYTIADFGSTISVTRPTTNVNGNIGRGTLNE
jgi:hypothetical protein